jgi:hypothetical protein
MIGVASTVAETDCYIVDWLAVRAWPVDREQHVPMGCHLP